MNRPLVSIYMPTKNRLQLLQRAVDSVLAQSYPAIELLVCDDGSIDGTASWLKKIALQDSRVVPVFHQQSMGACSARNAAVEVGSGYFITGLDDDDYFLPEHIASLVAAYDDHYSLVCSRYIEESGQRRKTQGRRVAVVAYPDILAQNLVGSQALMRRDRFLGVGGFDTTFPAWQDHELWVRMIRAYGPARKIMDCNYVHVHTGMDRITNSENIQLAFQSYVEKYQADLTPGMLLSLSFTSQRYGNGDVSHATIRAMLRTPYRDRALAYLLSSFLRLFK